MHGHTYYVQVHVLFIGACLSNANATHSEGQVLVLISESGQFTISLAALQAS